VTDGNVDDDGSSTSEDDDANGDDYTTREHGLLYSTQSSIPGQRKTSGLIDL
jgi:hypothetical protein